MPALAHRQTVADVQQVPDPTAPFIGYAANVNRYGLTAIVWGFFAVATVFVFLRIWVRWRQNGRLRGDDIWVIFAWLTLLTMDILQMQQLGPMWYLLEAQAGRIIKSNDWPRYCAVEAQQVRWEFAIVGLLWTVLWSVKASFLQLFFNLVRPLRLYRYLWYGVATFTALAYVANWLALITTCNPPSDYFVYGECTVIAALDGRGKFNVIFSSCLDVVSDCMIMSMPFALLPKLQLDSKRKLGLGFAFGLACMTVAAAIVRMTQVIQGESVDLLGLALFGAVEASVSMIVASLPPLKAFLTHGLKIYTAKRSAGKSTSGMGGGRRGTGTTVGRHYGNQSVSRSAMMAESIPLDDMHSQEEGRIYVRKEYNLRFEREQAKACERTRSSGDRNSEPSDEEVHQVSKQDGLYIQEGA